jgi:hypothetical protein
VVLLWLEEGVGGFDAFHGVDLRAHTECLREWCVCSEINKDLISMQVYFFGGINGVVVVFKSPIPMSHSNASTCG